ncbi:alpha-ribazole phosphatase/probable phosphoglycerate mutase [Actinacidiphila yanglinensis]|uniref:Alpha-ribazole phosphatase/probable phosphoglycerate mutase n=1 Tax=Actinacidiphila yanglinensis TaxID=310779 RepID=A0A1H6C9D2_9ACTN|nr:histidine phosphatase family protein [Actinacidiphila yanglinensis]SEG69503.1 alpha-ribazole phosphatase/probable phosphoglycerate mutase [Actinacidiphila yanglinensis]
MNAHLRVWCLRHAESENVTSGIAGAVPHAALTARGREQAAAAGRVLAAHRPVAVCTSSALRARETGRIVAEAAGGVVTRALPSLVEVGIGTFEGSADPAVHRRTAEVLHAWVVGQDLDQRVADGESGHEVLARVTGAFDDIAAAHPGDTVAVVGHVASLTAALSHLCGLGPAVWGTPLPHAAPFLVIHDGRTWHCQSWPAPAPTGN